MKLVIAKCQVFRIASMAFVIGVVGCQKAATTTDKQESNPVVPPVVIADGKTPTENQKQAMLAAKEELYTKLSSRLMEAMSSEGPAGAILVCKQEAPKIAADVSQELGLRIGRTGVRLRNVENQPPDWAESLIEARTDTPSFAVLDNGDAAALLPIKLQAQCLMCHGPKDQIAPGVKEQLATLYPNDQATEFNEGDLRGWFWIELPGQ
ncbi:MAG: DUF3365 domain-containing protein [Planctomycetales bacterium]|nr:DUF3365 domain-containing protein [Planctomycetales bacterium]